MQIDCRKVKDFLDKNNFNAEGFIALLKVLCLLDLAVPFHVDF